MRIVLDMQSCQSPSRLRGIGRYSMALAKALVRRAADHEVIVALNGALGDTIDGIRADFDGLLPRERIVVWSQPADVGFLTPTAAGGSRRPNGCGSGSWSRFGPTSCMWPACSKGSGTMSARPSGRSPRTSPRRSRFMT